MNFSIAHLPVCLQTSNQCVLYGAVNNLVGNLMLGAVKQGGQRMVFELTGLTLHSGCNSATVSDCSRWSEGLKGGTFRLLGTEIGAVTHKLCGQ